MSQTDLQPGEVKIGDFSFNPVQEQDFRLAVEGASKTGKSNTTAVILEDLASSNIPTLVIERLGILSSVKKEDDNMIVVGAREEKGIDLAIPLQHLDQVIDLMFEKGLKIILDVSTYSDSVEGSGEHAAAAKALKELNRRSQENLRTGNRLKSLVVIDEVHKMAPESGSPHIDVDDHVKKSRSEIVDVFTEGGNKGINAIVAYQRRAYTTKGIVSQADNYIIHRLNKTDRGDVSSEIGVTEEDIAELGTGEVFIYGDLTKQKTREEKVRKRTSPDPREQQFDLPEPSEELSEALSEVQENIEIQQEEEEKRKNRIEKLEKKLEEKEDRIEELESNRNLQQRLVKALEGARNNGGTADIQEEIEEYEEMKQELEEENTELRNKIDSLNKEIETLNSEVREKEDRIDELKAELNERKELELVEDNIVDSARSILRQLGELNPDVEDARQEIKELKDEVSRLEEEKQQLKKQKSSGSSDSVDSKIETYEEVLEDDRIQEELKVVINESSASGKAVKGVLSSIISSQGFVGYEQIANNLNYSDTTNVSKAVSALERAGILKSETRDEGKFVDIDFEAIEEVREKQKEREDTKEIMDRLDFER